jgi:hypothetical protein
VAGGFAKVQRTRDERNAPVTDDRGRTTFGGGFSTGGQVQDLGGGKYGVGAQAGAVGDVSDNFHDDPTVNAIVGLPSVKEAQEYTGKTPSFYGVQRPGDWQRKVQKDMAADALGSREALAAAIEARVQLARRGGGPFQV